MIYAIAHEVRIRPQPRRFFLVIRRTEIYDRREVLAPDESLQHLDTITLVAVHAAKQDQVVSGTRELVRQMAGRNRVVRRDNRVRPVRRNVMHEQRPKIGLLIDDHDFDAQARPRARLLDSDSTWAASRFRLPCLLCSIVAACLKFTQILVRGRPRLHIRLRSTMYQTR